MNLKDFKKAYYTIFQKPEDFLDESKVSRISSKLSDRYLKNSFKLYNYQYAAAYAISNCGNILLSDKPGLGKTAETIAAFSDIYTREKGKYLVICPASIISQWEDSIKNFSNFTYLTVTNTNIHKLNKIEEYDIIIMSIEIN